MRNKYTPQFFLLMFVLLESTVYSKDAKGGEGIRTENSFGVFAGMTIDVVRAKGIVEYVNSTSLYSQRVDDWGTAVDFFGGMEIPVGEEWEIKLEHSYLFKSYTFIGSNSGTYDLFYSIQAPTVSIQQVHTGKGYFVKYGAGIGPRFGFLSQKVSLFGTHTDYSTTGFGLKGELVGQTAFDQNFYGYIAGHIGYEFLGRVGSNNPSIYTDVSQLTGAVSMNYFYAGLRFGVLYYF